jgi:hypothetical protein
MLYVPRRGLITRAAIETLELRQMLSASFRLVEDNTTLTAGGDGSILVRADPPRFSNATVATSGSTSSAGTSTSSVTSAFNVNIVAGAGLQSNAAALAAFERAAAQWEARITDPISVNVDADLSNIGSNTIIGQTGSVTLQGDYSLMRGAVVSDAADETDDSIVASLPTTANFILPSKLTYDGSVATTKANLKALGFDTLDADFGNSDAQITFNSQFAFDYDNSDGVTPGTMDFETVAAHEIGHALGFVSAVDNVDYYKTYSVQSDVGADALDLFRFENNVAGRDPSNTSEFASFPRSLNSGVDAITDDITGWGASTAENRMSTGVGTGDGRQASHWKDGNLTGTSIGILDPTLSYEQVVTISDADWRALDLIGWDIADVSGVTPVQPPSAVDDSGATDEDHVLAASAPGVMANDSDGSRRPMLVPVRFPSFQ